MKTHDRRSFLKIAISGIIGFAASLLFNNKQTKTGDKPLKEANFYKKHDLNG